MKNEELRNLNRPAKKLNQQSGFSQQETLRSIVQNGNLKQDTNL